MIIKMPKIAQQRQSQTYLCQSVIVLECSNVINVANVTNIFMVKFPAKKSARATALDVVVGQFIAYDPELFFCSGK